MPDTERADLLEALAAHRGFLLHTVEGLTDDQARQRTTVSELTLGGLVKHVAMTEEAWVTFILEGPATMAMTPESFAAHADGFVLRDVSEDVARKVGVKHVAESATGRGSIAGYTVVYERGKPPRGVAIVDIGDARAVVQSEDPAIVARMESVELCGATVQLGENHSYTL